MKPDPELKGTPIKEASNVESCASEKDTVPSPVFKYALPTGWREKNQGR
ncbi:MAG: hypothetical protein M0P11_03275 [Anaerolineaceae bacterium]|nr:hypothetical protein [Anaerolineaceae bacterium]